MGREGVSAARYRDLFRLSEFKEVSRQDFCISSHYFLQKEKE